MPTALKFSPLLLALTALLAFNTNVRADDDGANVALTQINLGTHVHGPEIEADALAGKVVVIEYWGDRCGTCLRGIPHLKDTQAKYGRDKLILIANQVWTEESEVAKRAWENAGGGDQITVINHGALHEVEVQATPYAFVFSHDGTLAWHGNSARPEFDSAIETAIKAMPETEQN